MLNVNVGYGNPFATHDNPYAMPKCPICHLPIPLSLKTNAPGYGGGYTIAPPGYMPQCFHDWDAIQKCVDKGE